MFCAHKNSYLQLTCTLDPRLLNKAVDVALIRPGDSHDIEPASQRLESMQPSLFAPLVDVSRARLGFGRVGLKILVRDLHSKEYLVQLQAVHSLMDQVQITENALFLIDLHVVFRLIDLMDHESPIVKEKVCLILTQLANYYQGRKQIISRPSIIEKLINLIVEERKEIRFAAANTLKTLSKNRCEVEAIIKCNGIVEILLKSVTQDYSGIVLLHLKTLANLIEWDPVRPLKLNAFHTMLSLLGEDDKIKCTAMNCLAQLLKHPIGRELSDKNDLTFKLRPFLNSNTNHIEVVISAVSLMQVTTLTTCSKWRAKEICVELTECLVELCHCHNKPLLQLSCMQILVNLCDCPDVRNYMKRALERKVIGICIRNHEDWDGTSETTTYGLETGHNYRTMCIEDLETIRNDFGDNALTVNVHSYIQTLQNLKERLIRAINWKCYKN